MIPLAVDWKAVEGLMLQFDLVPGQFAVVKRAVSPQPTCFGPEIGGTGI